MTGTTEGGKKAAAHQDMSDKGRKGAEALASDAQNKSQASRKAAEHQDMGEKGRKGGENSHGGNNSNR